jgi:MFS family permease
VSLGEGKGFYYGWVIAVCTLVIMWITNGMTLAGLTVFDEELLVFLGGASGSDGLRGALKFRDTITLLGSGLLAPLAGAIADRVGVRPLMIVGFVLLSVANFLYARIESMGEIYAIHVLIAMSLAGAGLVVNVMIVSKWFVKNRGLAVGLTVAGTSLGNAALPQLNAWLVSEFGWRLAFTYTAGIPLLLIPVVLFVMREKPEDMGLVAPGSEGLAAGRSHTQLGLSYRDALRTGNFWILATVAMLTFYSILALLTHLFLQMRDQGFEPQVAASGLTVLFLLGLVGKIASGILADLLGRKQVFLGSLGVMCVGAWLLVSANAVTFWPAIVLLGAGWGGLYTLLQLLAAETFGVRDLGKILGTITVLDTFGGGMGPFLTGVMYDAFGAYTIPFAVIAGLVTLALVLATRFRLRSAR